MQAFANNNLILFLGCRTDVELPDVLLHNQTHQRLCSTLCPSEIDHPEIKPVDVSGAFRDDPADKTYYPVLDMSTVLVSFQLVPTNCKHFGQCSFERC